MTGFLRDTSFRKAKGKKWLSDSLNLSPPLRDTRIPRHGEIVFQNAQTVQLRANRQRLANWGLRLD